MIILNDNLRKLLKKTNGALSLYEEHPTERRLESSNFFLRSLKPAEVYSYVILQ